MTARETVLGRVRDALALAPPSEVTVPRDYRTGRALPDRERLELFVRRLEDYRAEVRVCTSAQSAEMIAEVLAEHRVATLAVPTGLDQSWLADYGGAVWRDSAELSAPDLDAVDGVLTSSAVSCAETGSILLDGSPDQGRRALSLVPDLHVCVVDLSTVRVGVPETVADLTPGRPTTLISGPSATSDIELERVEGVHGPRTLVVLVRTDV